MAAFLPYGRQTIEDDDVAAVVQALRSDMLTTGPRVEEFEAAFAAVSGAKHAVASNSGTAALHLAAMAAGLGPGDLAIVPTLTFLATANAVRMTGAEVVFADVDDDTGLLTTVTLEQAITRAKKGGGTLKAAFPVHLNGQVCDMAGLAGTASRHDIVMVEDACHALGVAGIGVARHSASACFSTHPVKAIATGEGGVTTTGDATTAEAMRSLRSHGMMRDPSRFALKDQAFDAGNPNPWYYEMPVFGWNYRMPDLLCALGVSQLKKLARFYARRLEIVARYDELLSPLAPILRPVPHGSTAHGWHIYAVLIDFQSLGLSRRQVMEALRSRDIGSQVHYVPVHRQPYYRDRYGALVLPGADNYYNRCLSIPLFPLMSDADVDRVVAALTAIVAGKVS